MDSDGDGVGDLRGITSRLEHLADAGIGATWMSPIFKSPMVDFGYDIEDYMAIQPEYGSMEDFDALMEEASRLGIRVVLDFVPNHSSDRCEWFRRSAARDPGYADFYVWHDGRENPDGGQPLVPNNWVGGFVESCGSVKVKIFVFRSNRCSTDQRGRSTRVEVSTICISSPRSNRI